MRNFACKGHPRNDLYCVGWDVKPYSLTHSLLPGRNTHAPPGTGRLIPDLPNPKQWKAVLTSAVGYMLKWLKWTKMVNKSEDSHPSMDGESIRNGTHY